MAQSNPAVPQYIREHVAGILEAVKGIPFARRADRARWLSHLCEAATGSRQVHPGRFVLIHGKRRTGKTTLATRSCALLGADEFLPMPTDLDCDQEFNQTITFALKKGYRLVIFDDVWRGSGCDSVVSYLSSTEWCTRSLGEKMAKKHRPTSFLWATTSDALRFAADLGRRVDVIKLKNAEPTGAYRPDAIQEAQAHLRELVKQASWPEIAAACAEVAR